MYGTAGGIEMAVTEAERTIADQNTGETLTFLETSEETGGDHVVVRLTLAPGTVIPPHAHPIQETFTCEDVPVGFHLDGRWADLGPGEVVSAASGRVHGLRNTSDQPVSVLVTATPGAIAEHQLRMKFLLSRDGYIPVPGGGRPKDPLLGAVIIDRDGLYLPPLPRWLFRGMIRTMATIGRRRGRERFLLEHYPEYADYLRVLGEEHGAGADSPRPAAHRSR
jgi:quercetin dioxygenase-like cupin family protein